MIRPAPAAPQIPPPPRAESPLPGEEPAEHEPQVQIETHRVLPPGRQYFFFSSVDASSLPGHTDAEGPRGGKKRKKGKKGSKVDEETLKGILPALTMVSDDYPSEDILICKISTQTAVRLGWAPPMPPKPEPVMKKKDPESPVPPLAPVLAAVLAPSARPLDRSARPQCSPPVLALRPPHCVSHVCVSRTAAPAAVRAAAPPACVPLRGDTRVRC